MQAVDADVLSRDDGCFLIDVLHGVVIPFEPTNDTPLFEFGVIKTNLYLCPIIQFVWYTSGAILQIANRQAGRRERLG